MPLLPVTVGVTAGDQSWTLPSKGRRRGFKVMSGHKTVTFSRLLP